MFGSQGGRKGRVCVHVQYKKLKVIKLSQYSRRPQQKLCKLFVAVRVSAGGAAFYLFKDFK